MESLNGEPNSNDASTSKSQEEAGKDSEKSKKNEKTNSVPFRKLFTFADSADIALMIIGTIGAIGNGLCLPLIGELVDSFGENQNTNEMVDKVSKVSLKFVYLGIGAGIASFLQVACWMITGEWTYDIINLTRKMLTQFH